MKEKKVLEGSTADSENMIGETLAAIALAAPNLQEFDTFAYIASCVKCVVRGMPKTISSRKILLDCRDAIVKIAGEPTPGNPENPMMEYVEILLETVDAKLQEFNREISQ